MNPHVELVADEGQAGTTLEWSIAYMVHESDGRFILFDEDENPRLILDADELAKLAEEGYP